MFRHNVKGKESIGLGAFGRPTHAYPPVPHPPAGNTSSTVALYTYTHITHAAEAEFRPVPWEYQHGDRQLLTVDTNDKPT